MYRVSDGILSSAPSRYYSSLLHLHEHNQPLGKKKFKRRRFSYDLNRSIARRIDKWILNMVPTLNHEEIRDAIADHAYRRIQIFYYQSVAYFKTNCDIFLGRTDTQHGTSNYSWSEAAHSSLLTNLYDNYFAKLQVYGITENSARILRSLGISEEKIQKYQNLTLTQNEIDFLIEDIDFKKGLIHPNSALYASMNATVELPFEVNEFDTVLERNIRRKALEILNNVANNELHPYRGTQLLVEEMWGFFQRSLDETRKKIDVLKRIETLKHHMLFLEKNLNDQDVKTYLSILEQLQDLTNHLKNLREFSIQRNNTFSLNWRSQLLLMKNPSNSKVVKKVKKMTNEDFTFQNQDDYIKKLENSLDIIRMQWENTRTPPLKILSGNFLSEARLEADRLFEEQLQVIKRD